MTDSRQERRGLMLVISSPSGAGKTSLARALLEEYDDVVLSISATTRKPRPKEVEGHDYYFKSQSEFRRMVDNEEFLEWARVFDEFYGTPRMDTVNYIESGRDVLFDVDWQGAGALRDHMPNDVVSVFVLPPSLSELESRLKARPGSTTESVSRRMQDAKAEIMRWRHFDYCIVNDVFEYTYAKLKQILHGEREKRLRQTKLEPLVRRLLGDM